MGVHCTRGEPNEIELTIRALTDYSTAPYPFGIVQMDNSRRGQGEAGEVAALHHEPDAAGGVQREA